MKKQLTKQDKIASFNPNALGMKDANVYGLPFDEHESDIVLFPVPWEVTVSYSGGTAAGPAAILDASYQVDLFDARHPETWKAGIFMQEPSAKWSKRSDKFRKKAEEYIAALEDGKDPAGDKSLQRQLDEINEACAGMVAWVKEETSRLLEAGKMVGLVGGDHSTPLGYIQALAEKHGEIGILHVDAHADLRNAYEGFTYSHASIMFNALKVQGVAKLVQAGIRDYCEEEAALAKQDSRVVMHTMRDLKKQAFEGRTWKDTCMDIVSALPQKVYISFDIDGLDPSLCPHTGTPVPDGFGYEEALYLLHAVLESGRRIVGFDLVEVAPGEDEWDGNVGARLLYRMCALAAAQR